MIVKEKKVELTFDKESGSYIKEELSKHFEEANTLDFSTTFVVDRELYITEGYVLLEGRYAPFAVAAAELGVTTQALVHAVTGINKEIYYSDDVLDLYCEISIKYDYIHKQLKHCDIKIYKPFDFEQGTRNGEDYNTIFLADITCNFDEAVKDELIANWLPNIITRIE